MRIAKGVEILDGLPVLYLESLSAVVCSDLHLGYEGVMADKGVFMPKVNLKRIKDILGKAYAAKKPKRIIVDGDIKNEFSAVHLEEFNEFGEFMKFVKGLGVEEVVLIKGNHDNFIERVKSGLGFKSYAEEALMGDFLFFHGDELPREKRGKTMVMGHMHPSIGVYNSVGVKEKLRCFLHGRARDGRDVIVLPAMNYFAEGFDATAEDAAEICPVFKSMLDVEAMHALCIGDKETLDFGSIKDIRKIAYR